jgi:hypothetical protein
MSLARPHPYFERGNQMYRILTLENGETMTKPGYLNVSVVYAMPWQGAQPLWARDGRSVLRRRLDRASMRTVLDALNQIAGYRRHGHNGVHNPASSSLPPAFPSIPGDASHGPQTTSGQRTRVPVLTPAATDPLQTLLQQSRMGLQLAIPAKPDRNTSSHGERRPLLPTHHQNVGPGGGPVLQGFLAWLWDNLKRTRLGVIVRSLLCQGI